MKHRPAMWVASAIIGSIAVIVMLVSVLVHTGGWIEPAIMTVFVLGLAAAVWWIRGYRDSRKVHQVLRNASQSDSSIPLVIGAHDEHAAVQSTLRYLGEALAKERERTQAQLACRARVEAELKASEERYALALMGADEGLWEWNLKSNKVHYSDRWRRMLGLAEVEIEDSIDEWCDRIHPSDREQVKADLKKHLDGVTSRFENAHRVLHRDGTYRWVMARATAIRHANGSVARLVGLATDITERKQIQQSLVELAEGLGDLRGDECLKELVRCFAQTLGVREVFVCECVDFPTTEVRMLARWQNGHFDTCVEFNLRGTACADVISSGQLIYHPVDAGARWPLELQYDRNSYLGMPCIDSQGQVIGHIACADPGPMPLELPHESLLRIFAVRASIELERRTFDRMRSRDLTSHLVEEPTLH